MSESKTVVVGISGASGAIYAVELLRNLAKADNVRTHVVFTPIAREIITYETSVGLSDIQELADFCHDITDFNAPIASGSYLFHSMVIVPCSMKTLAAINAGYAENLMTRAADVALKERRKLILVTRETPLSLIHLRNMQSLTEAGAIIMPASPGFYYRPESLNEMVSHFVGRVLTTMGIENKLAKAWGVAEPVDMEG